MQKLIKKLLTNCKAKYALFKNGEFHNQQKLLHLKICLVILRSKMIK